jgi:hypothetical protein
MPPIPPRRRPVEDQTPATPVRDARRFDDPVEAVDRVQHLPPPPNVPTIPAGVDTPIPEASRTPGEAAAAALRRDRAQLEGKLAAERAARERAEAEAAAAKAAARAGEAENAPQAPAVPPPVWSAAGKLMLAVAGFITLIGTPLGVYLTARAAALEPKVDRTEVKTNVTEQKTDTNSEALTSATKRIQALEKCNQDRLNWYLEIERQRGVDIRRPENLPAPGEVKVTPVPPAFRGRGPIMVVETPPPC